MQEMQYYGTATNWWQLDLSELWRSRGLAWMLARRDLQVRYRQTLVGVAWAVIQPVATMVVFVVFFNLLKKNPTTGDAPYFVSLYCALIPWQFFSSAITKSTRSLVANQNLIRRVYFPRLILPIASITAGTVDFGIALAVLAGLMLYGGVAPTAMLTALPVFLALMLLSTLAISVWVSATNAIFRDVEQIVPFALQMLFFLSPVTYETSAIVPAEWRPLYSLNPLVSVLDGFRSAILGQPLPPADQLAGAFAIAAVVLISGLVFFKRVERSVADRI